MLPETLISQSSPTEHAIRFFDLDKIRFIIKDATGLDVAYAYDDLVFAENAIFIIQFDATDSNTFNCYFNIDCIEANRMAMLASLHATAELNASVIHYKGKFELLMNDQEDTFGVRFL